MFTELMPLLAERAVLITLARESDTTLRATVIPKRAKEAENAALTTPLSFVGTAEELDREFGRALAEYVEAHQRLGSTLAQAKAEMEVAAKAAQEEAKRKADEKRKAKPSTSTAVPSVTTQPVSSVSPDTAPAPASTLFSEAPAESAQSQRMEGGLRL